MTRLISGVAGGRRLKVPRTGVRPTGDRAREALFNSLGAAARPRGAAVLDLYAGSGALGLEALSRGAADGGVRRVRARRAAGAARTTSPRSGCPAAGCVAGSVPTVVGGAPSGRFDLVLADPPYATPAEEVLGVLGRWSRNGWLAPDAVVVVERSSRDEPFEWPTPLVGLRDRRYGEALLRYGRSS